MIRTGEKVLLVAGVFLVASMGNALELSPIVSNDDVFEMNSKPFIKKYVKRGFKWNNKEKTQIMSVPPQVMLHTLFSEPVCETVIDLKDDKVNAISISIYNRGDARPISSSKFYKILSSIRKDLDKAFNLRGSNLPTNRVAQQKIYSAEWKSPKRVAVLEWSTSGRLRSEFTAEYINLKIAPPGDASGNIRATVNDREQLTEKIIRKPDGTVYLNLPMVDQGAKSYCAASTVERVLKYYGSDVSQHFIAQIAGTTAGGGSQLHELLAGLKKADTKLGVKVVDNYDCGFKLDCFKNYSKFKGFLRNYNKAAKKIGEKRYSEKQIFNAPSLLVVMMRSKAFIEMRKDDRSGFREFQRVIHKNIDKGIPVFWGLIVGIVQEKKAANMGMGGHMRLISGYNDKTGEIIYSDTWGAGHEFKTMKISDAWAVTMDIFTLEPRIKRSL